MTTINREPMSIDGAVQRGVAKYRITHADLTDADTSQTITLSDLALRGGSRVPAKARVESAWYNVITAFAGGGNTAVVAKLGDAADDDELITDVSIMATGIKPFSGAYTRGTYEAAYAPKVVVTTTDGTCLGLTAGVLEIFIEYSEITSTSLTRD